MALGLAGYLTGTVRSVYGFDLALILTLVGGLPIFLEAAGALLERRISADLAVSLAAIAALAIGQYAVAAEVVLIMLIGEALEHFAVGRTRSGIAALLALRPNTARVRRHGEELTVRVDDVRAGDLVILRPGDRIPVDGTILKGSSSVDQSPLTGESIPVDKLPGDDVFAGTINLHGAAEVRAEKTGRDTTLEHVIRLVEDAERAKAPTQRLADRYAAWFVPVVILAAVVTYFLTREVTRSVAVLVVACPCALVLATPTAIAAGIGRLVRNGVLVKGGTALETLGRLQSIVFDKTGTLTLARLQIARIVPASGHDQTAVLQLAASVEQHSEHPVGQVIVERARQEGLTPLETTDFAAHPGLGAVATTTEGILRVGSPRFIENNGIRIPEDMDTHLQSVDRGETVILVAQGDAVIGRIAVSDTIRPEAAEAIRNLRDSGVRRIAMLTGDNDAAARTVAAQLGIDEYRAELLPQDKVAAIRQIQQESGPTAMVGDGINDAPSLTVADVGVAMGDVGTDAAIASADVVLVGEDLRKLVAAVRCGRQALRIIWQNILAFALAFNALAVLVASLGWISPVVAAVLHQVSSLTVVLNSLRLLIDWPAWCEGLTRLRTRIWDRRRPLLKWCGAGVLTVYLLSGLHIVAIGEVGVVQRFGRVVPDAEDPGVHCRLPAPFGRHFRVRTSRIRRVEIGFRTIGGEFAEPLAYEWNVQHRGGRRVRRDDEAMVWTGDENLVDLNMVVLYRVIDPQAALFAVGRESLAEKGQSKWDVLVRAVARKALAAEMCGRPVEAALNLGRADVERAIKQRLEKALSSYASPVGAKSVFSIQAVCLSDVHPPLEVVPAFREVASALEDKEARINDAVAYRNETEMLVEGQASERILTAEAGRTDRASRAQGEATRFVTRAKAYAEKPEITRHRLYLETMEAVLAGKTKIVMDAPESRGRRILLLGNDVPWKLATLPAAESTAEQGEQQ